MIWARVQSAFGENAFVLVPTVILVFAAQFTALE